VRARAEQLVEEGAKRRGEAQAITRDPPRFVNTTLLLRINFEIVAVVPRDTGGRRPGPLALAQVLVASAIMVVVSYIAIGVGPRTIGRQHSGAGGFVAARPISWLTAVLGPIRSC
jgi:CBS domain containing-hemolysin-like protein